VVLGLLRPADQEAAVAVEPLVGALDDPAAGAVVGLAPKRLGFLAARADVRGEAELADQLADDRVVVALVEAEALRPAPGRLRALDRNRCDRRLEQLLVVAVGAVVRYPERDAAGVDKERALRPFLALSVGFGPVLAPPSGAFVIAPSAASQSQSMPASSS
jgi:hypothetical protein